MATQFGLKEKSRCEHYTRATTGSAGGGGAGATGMKSSSLFMNYKAVMETSIGLHNLDSVTGISWWMGVGGGGVPGDLRSAPNKRNRISNFNISYCKSSCQWNGSRVSDVYEFNVYVFINQFDVEKFVWFGCGPPLFRFVSSFFFLSSLVHTSRPSVSLSVFPYVCMSLFTDHGFAVFMYSVVNYQSEYLN